MPSHELNDDGWDLDRFTLEALQIRDKWDQYSHGEKSRDNLMALVAELPSRYRIAALAFLQCGYDAKSVALHKLDLDHLEAEGRQEVARSESTRAWQRETRAFWVGLSLLLIALAASVMVPVITLMASLILRLVAGAGVGLLIAFLPALFSINSEINVARNKIVIRATGGIAALVMVYFFDPGWISNILKFSK